MNFGEPDFVKSCTKAAVGLHNFLEERDYGWDDEEVAGDAEVQGQDDAVLEGGESLRDKLRQWMEGN